MTRTSNGSIYSTQASLKNMLLLMLLLEARHDEHMSKHFKQFLEAVLEYLLTDSFGWLTISN